MMAKKKGSYKNVLFFFLGALIYSFLFWFADYDSTQVFGMILIALLCYVLHKVEYKKNFGPELIKTESVISMCAGVIFDSLAGGFPFSFFH